MAFDNKEYARQLRENAVKDSNGAIICSPELWEQIASIIENAPTADVEEVKHGEWKDRYEDKYYNKLYVCSACGREALLESYKNELGQWNERQVLTPICPHCGAKMNGTPKERGEE